MLIGISRPSHNVAGAELFGALLLACVVVTGCGGGGPVAMVSGTVSLGDQPVAGACVTLLGGTAAEAATTDDQGRFRFSTSIPTGIYSVSISTEDTATAIDVSGEEYAAIMSGKAKPPSATAIDRVPAKYRSPGTSGLRFDLNAGANEITISLDN